MLRRQSIRATAAALTISHTRTAAMARFSSGAPLQPKGVPGKKPWPAAKKVPHVVQFGVVDGESRGTNPMDPPRTMVDDYFWLRDDTREDEAVLAHLREENAYTEAATADLDAFRETLYAEMLSHVKEDDATFPYLEGGWLYFSRTMKGSAFKQYVRRLPGAGAEEAVYLDVNVVATTLEHPEQCDVNEIEVSPGGGLFAFTVDDTGRETYDVVVRRFGEAGDVDRITETAGSVAWADDATFFYTRHDETHRPHQVWRHTLGDDASNDALVFEDLDDLFNVVCWRELDGSMVVIQTESKETAELHFVPTTDPTRAPTLALAKRFGVQFDFCSHAPSKSVFCTTNDAGKKNRELLVADVLDGPNGPSVGPWRPLLVTGGGAVLPHCAARSLERPHAFQGHVVVEGREGGFTQIWTVPLASGGGGAEAAAPAKRVAFEDDAYDVDFGANAEFDAVALRLRYSSMTSPTRTLAYDLEAATLETLKVDFVPNYDQSLYETRRIECPSRDGETVVPVTLFYRKDSGCVDRAVHLYGYGAYGACMDPSFRATRLALVDRGVVYAIAHVRGGGEMGFHAWYEQGGKYLTKKNTFFDFVDCAKHLRDTGVANQISIEGRSAGGLLVGTAVNLAPELFTACVAGVPFVDLMVTMCDPSIPLTSEEWEEWGNPNEEEYFDYMRDYSPMDNVQPVNYPQMLLVSGLNDPRVAFWEPTKWAARLRDSVANPEAVLLKMDLAAGHFSANDRYRYLRELAFDYAWLLNAIGKVADEDKKPRK
ncbi:prolyl oligopeptidase [Pelagophyceae sp. CCMP2097]|nr:prolyl oligopeptidase [Pelagophyceae sp. CCMP2097]